jgi:hypothetical protein
VYIYACKRFQGKEIKFVIENDINNKCLIIERAVSQVCFNVKRPFVATDMTKALIFQALVVEKTV